VSRQTDGHGGEIRGVQGCPGSKIVGDCHDAVAAVSGGKDPRAYQDRYEYQADTTRQTQVQPTRRREPAGRRGLHCHAHILPEQLEQIEFGLITPVDNGAGGRSSGHTGAMADERFLTLADVAEVLNVSISQTQLLVRRGDIEGVQIGGRGQWRVERCKLECYIARLYDKAQEFVAAQARS
jgi:excisionase family DNA binding protein